MRLNIVKRTTGREIVAAFLRAANYQESADARWEAMDFEEENGDKGVIAYPCQRKKRFWILGPARWVRDSDAVIFLHPLDPEETYDEIKVEARLARPSQRTTITSEVYDEWWGKYRYLQRQLRVILKNAFLAK